MSDSLVISVRLHEGWYHGTGAIPSPARIFQALIAGRGLSGPLAHETIAALEWLEQQPPPTVAAPVTKAGQSVVAYVPNNDLDAKQGDHRRIGEIRTKKSIRPLLFDADVPFIYCWELRDETRNDAAVWHVCELADSVYQLGRTVDAAWAWADVWTDDELNDQLRSHRGPIHCPSAGRGNVECPTRGSLSSLLRRYNDMSQRYAMAAEGRGQTFRRPSKPKWRMVSYDSAATRLCFDLTDRHTSTLVPWPTTQTVRLVTTVRDNAVQRLLKSLPDHETEIRQTLIGRTADGENAGSTSARVRIIPLPSIGHEQANQEIRRILIEIPGSCPLRTDDVTWAFAGQTFELHGRTIDLVRSQPHRQLEHYGVHDVTSNASRHWQTVTPTALNSASRRRIEPDATKRQRKDLKGAAEKRFEQEIAYSAVRHALRLAGIRATVRTVHVQREPFDQRGARVEPFAAYTRFNKHSLWHVDLEFETPVKGPLLIGDGRFLGLGLMRPVRTTAGVFAFSIKSGMKAHPDPIRLSRALRRAVMARAREVRETHHLPPYFTGHREDGAPARSETEPHLAFLFDPTDNTLFVITPDTLDRRKRCRNQDNFVTLELALQELHELRAGVDGHLRIQPIAIDLSRHRLFTTSHVWESLTTYLVNRHARRATAETTMRNDMLAECERRGLPRPEVNVLSWTSRSRWGLSGQVRLTFRHALQGPIILGKTRHFGGGVFSAADRGAIES
jgi:CRISPR-associated protein Csb2